eukprot:m.17251 g.17251  ORF g.17251 m.17251 type:complete len:127 (-) comp5157_c0_seq1:39-419(-)
MWPRPFFLAVTKLSPKEHGSHKPITSTRQSLRFSRRLLHIFRNGHPSSPWLYSRRSELTLLPGSLTCTAAVITTVRSGLYESLVGLCALENNLIVVRGTPTTDGLVKLQEKAIDQLWVEGFKHWCQ